MLKPTTKNIECQEEGSDIHAEDSGSPAYLCTTYLQDQSSRGRQAEQGKGLGQERRHTGCKNQALQSSGGPVKRVRAVGQVTSTRAAPLWPVLQFGFCVRFHINPGILAKNSLPTKSANPRPVP